MQCIRCGLLIQMSHVSVVWWFVRLSVCLFVSVFVARMRCAKTAEPIEMPFGAGSCGSEEPFRCRSRLDESIRRCEGQHQVGDAAFCQITLDIGSACELRRIYQQWILGLIIKRRQVLYKFFLFTLLIWLHELIGWARWMVRCKDCVATSSLRRLYMKRTDSANADLVYVWRVFPVNQLHTSVTKANLQRLKPCSHVRSRQRVRVGKGYDFSEIYVRVA